LSSRSLAKKAGRSAWTSGRREQFLDTGAGLSAATITRLTAQ
jgi:hypothetical protein